MTDPTGPPGWWLASDGKWYPPYLHPQTDQAPAAGLPQFAPFSPYGRPPGSGTTGSHGYYGYPSSAPFGNAPGYGYMGVEPTTNGLAITSLVLSILGLILFGIGSLLGIILGFVSRGQIKRANGAQKGAGLALSGIVVGFVTLFLGVAVAIPTFLGVEKASSDSVIRLAPTPIALGSPEEGGAAAPVPWVSGSEPIDTTLTAVPGGIDMAIGSVEHREFAGLPLVQSYPSIALSATVAIVAGTLSNGIGLGCITPTQSNQVAFLVHSSGVWQVVLQTGQTAGIIDSGYSSAVHSTGSNMVTIACANDVARPGSTLVSFEINGTPVSTDSVRVSSAAWIPTIQLCSCNGTDTGRFLNVAYYGSGTSPPSSTA